MLDREAIEREFIIKAIRSSGSGGQNVNKVATKAELQFNIVDSKYLSDEQKALLAQNLSTRLTKDGRIILQCDESRSQLKNKNLVITRFFELLEEGLTEDKERKKTKIPKAVKLKRLASKRKHSEKKANRKPPEI